MTQGCQSVKLPTAYLIFKKKKKKKKKEKRSMESGLLLVFHFPFHTVMSGVSAAGRWLSVVLKHVAGMCWLTVWLVHPTLAVMLVSWCDWSLPVRTVLLALGRGPTHVRWSPRESNISSFSLFGYDYSTFMSPACGWLFWPFVSEHRQQEQNSINAACSL